MNVFIPSKEDLNPYFHETTRFSQNKYFFGQFKDFNEHYQIVWFHWPEAIFDWEIPSQQNIDELAKAIQKWKKTAKIVYTRHDERSHYHEKSFRKLFQIIESSADLIIHLGEYSKNQLVSKYPAAKHSIVLHPLFEDSFAIFDKEEARKKLNINQDALVVLAPGKIRNIEERSMLLDSFKHIRHSDKILLSHHMLPFRSNLEFKGRTKLKRIIDVKKVHTMLLKKIYSGPNYYFKYGYIDTYELSLMASASDIFFIPRRNTLNSGNIFLGITYKKIMVGPAIGNIEEQLEQFDLPSFNPNSISSVKNALNKGIETYENDNFHFKDELLLKYKPFNISKRIDELFLGIKKN